MTEKREFIQLFDKYGRSIGSTNSWQRTPGSADFIIFPEENQWKVKDDTAGVVVGTFNSLDEALDYVNAQGVELLIIVKGAKRSDADPAKLLDNNSYVFTADAPGPFQDKTAVKAMAGAKHIWVQSEEPTAIEVGDIWIQTE